MAEKTLAILLTARNQASGPIRKVASDVGTLDRVAGRAGKGIHTLGRNLRNLAIGAGAIAVGGLIAGIKTGLDDLATLESATTSVTAAIKQMGQSGVLTGAQVATWANEIESNVGAAFDDKAITKAAASLIRYGKVAPANLRPAMVVMTDLAAKTGSVDSAAALLSKALADPAKASARLTRAGVTLTKSQEDQVKALVKAGKTAKAQKLLLDILAKTTKNAAAASQGPYQRSLSLLSDTAEDARKALAEGFLPVIERVAGVLQRELAKPETLTTIRDAGKSIADLFSRGLDAAQKVPWSSIADAMRLAGQGAKAAFDVFTGMPPWVQTAVLTGWGLNKLSGGAITGIVGELGKGLIKGVLGMNAGVVNARAGVVNVAGGIGAGGGLPGAAAGGGKLGILGALGLAGLGIGIGAAALDVSGVNAPEHQFNATNRFGGHTFRATRVPAAAAPTGVGFEELRRGERGAGRAASLAPGLASELTAIGRFAGSSAPSLRSMEAHLAKLRDLQAKVPSEDRMNTDLVVRAIANLQAAIAAWRPQVAVTVGVPARTVARSTVVYRRAANSGRVGID